MALVPVTVDPNRILLVDVSTYQGNVDFVKMSDKGVKGIIAKAGQSVWMDSMFTRNWKSAKEAGLPRASYFFYDSRTSPKLQAEVWAGQLGNDLGEFGLWCDFEERYKGTYTGWKHWYTFMERLKDLIPTARLGIYTGYYYWTELAPNPIYESSQLNYFKQYPLWIAAYQTNKPLIPKPFTSYLIHQFTETLDGESYGAKSVELDGNYFNGTEEEWSKFATLPIVQPLPQPSLYPIMDSVELLLKTGEKKIFIRK